MAVKEDSLENGDESHGELLSQGELFAREEYFQLEKSRIESDNRRTDVAKAAVEASDAADQRQYEYYMARLEKEAEEKSKTRTSAVKLVWAMLVGSFVVCLFLIGIAFFGTESQAKLSIDILKTILNAVGGFGIGWILLMVFRRYF